MKRITRKDAITFWESVLKQQKIFQTRIYKMGNIFEGAKFGDKFITKDSRILIYHCCNVLKEYPEPVYQLIEEFNSDIIICDNTGKCLNMDHYPQEYDIVSCYQELIDGKKMTKIAYANYKKGLCAEDGFIEGFKSGYKNATHRFREKVTFNNGIKLGDIVLADNNPYHEHSKDVPWAKGRLISYRKDACGNDCFYLEGAYTYFWRIVPYKKGELCLSTENGDYDNYFYNTERSNESDMKKFVISYYTLSGDYCTVHTNAQSRQEAEQAIRSEYWDIQKIVSINEES